MNPLNIGLIIVSVINVVFGLIVYLENKRGRANQFYALTVFFVATWTFSTGIFKESQSLSTASLWLYGIYLSGSLISWGFLYLSFFFPYQKVHLNKKQHFLLFLPNILIFILLLSPKGLVIKEILLNPGNNNLLPGSFYPFYFGCFTLYMSWGFLNLLRKYIESTGITKLQIKYASIGMLLPSGISIYFSLILPWQGNFNLVYLSHFSTLILVLFMAYAITKHYLMDIRLIATELFAGLIILVVLMHTVFSPSLGEFLIRGTFLLFVTISGILLVRGNLREFKQREQMTVVLEQRVKERTKELEAAKKAAESATEEIRKRKEELEKFYKLTIGRELKMTELKKKIEELEKKIPEKRL